LATAYTFRFLLARLHVDSLTDKFSTKQVKSALAKLPQGSNKIDIAYEQVLERIDSQRPGHVELAKKVLSWVVYAKRPLTTRELCCALTVEPGDSKLDISNEPDIDDMVSVCAGLVVVDEESSIVRLVHYTTQDFLERISTEWFPDAELHIATICITYLCFEGVRFTRPTWQSRRKKLRNFSLAQSKSPEYRIPKSALLDFPLADYAILHWVEHTRPFEASLSTLIRALFDRSNNLFNALRRYDYSWLPTYRYIVELETGIQFVASHGLTQTLSDMLPSSREQFAAMVDHATIFGVPPLVAAAAHGHKSTVRLLLDSGADIEAHGSKEFKGTTLFEAAARGAKSIGEMLIDYGANAGATCADYTTALQAAVFHGHLDIAKLLLSAGACPNAYPGHFGTALAIGASQGNEEMATILIEAGADLNQRESGIGTALHWAAVAGKVRVVQLLLKAGAEVNPEVHRNGTVLQWAEVSGCKEVAELLRVAGADQKVQCEWHHIALAQAALTGRTHLLQRLIDSCIEMEPERYMFAMEKAEHTSHTEVLDLVRRYKYRIDLPPVICRSPEGFNSTAPTCTPVAKLPVTKFFLEDL
jgi:ankyrin repeat protein